LSEDVFQAARNAVEREIDEAQSNAAEIDSHSTLEDHIKALHRIAPRAGIAADRVQKAVSAIESRMAEIEDRTDEAVSPEFSGRVPRDVDRFDDTALRNLFAPLLGSTPAPSTRGQRSAVG
jgi:hypothetical protein